MMASHSPSMKGLASRGHSPSPRLVPTSRMPSGHQLITTLPHNVTVTPASARTFPSNVPSPYLLSPQPSPAPSAGHDTPPHTANPAPLELPESMMSREFEAQASPTLKDTPPHSIRSESTAPSSKSGGIMRKLSYTAKSGAQNGVMTLRRKTSAINQRREPSTGPISRRRSDSKTFNNSNGSAIPDAEAADFEQRKLNDAAFGLNLHDASDTFTDTDPVSPIDKEPQGVAPTVPLELVKGLSLVKITKRKRKAVKFFLDPEGSRVSWTGTVLQKHFWIDDIRNIRSGKEVITYRQELKSPPEEADRWCTILYADQVRPKQTKILHLITHTDEDLKLVIDTIEACSKHREVLMTGMIGSGQDETIIRTHWERQLSAKSTLQGTITGEDGLDISAIQDLCRRLHIHLSKCEILARFQLADVRKNGRLNYAEYKEFVLQLQVRQDLKQIYESIKSNHETGLTKDQFLSFLENTQKMEMSSANTRSKWEAEFIRWVELANSRMPQEFSEGIAMRRHMSFQAFASFMVSKACSVYQPDPSSALDRPLNEYFISSSHNTYLRGKQILGDSSSEMYITALRHGCRCVEIDCWDGSDGEPRVTHGHTGTSSVPFFDVISVIKRYAFEASSYPLILSLEVHCVPEQQARMVQIMKDVLGEQLLLNLLDENSDTLPSPERLKSRILVKVKNARRSPAEDQLAGAVALARQQGAGSPSVRPSLPVTPVQSDQLSPSGLPMSTLTNGHVEDFRVINEKSTNVTSASSGGEDSDTLQTAPTSASPPTKAKPTKITKALGDLGVYLQGYTYYGFNAPHAHDFNHIFSLNEKTVEDICKKPEEKAQYEDHNVRYMSRVYPAITRVRSDNFDPNTFWRRGVQMVALNWQTHDEPMQMNQAMFAAGSDQSGYVLKPAYLRQDRRVSGSLSKRLKLPKYLVKFSVQVISAQQLPRLPNMTRSGGINPFIEVQMFSAEDKTKGIVKGTGGYDAKSSSENGAYGIGSPYSRRTHVVMDNGYNPHFNDRIELSLETKYPELVFVRWIVWHSPTANRPNNNKNCTQVATFTAKLGSLKEGYRHLPIFNSHLEEFIFSTLFCKIDKAVPQKVAVNEEEEDEEEERKGRFSTK